MRKFLYDAKRNKFFKQMLYLCKKTKNKEFNNLKDKYNTWKDECVFKNDFLDEASIQRTRGAITA